MSTVTKKKLQDVLTTKLNLVDARFVLEKAGAKLSGNIISATFSGKDDQQRQRMIWDALEDEFGAQCVHLVGTLLAYTPEEWGVNLEATSKK